MDLIKKNSKNIIFILIIILFAYTIIFKGDFSIILDVVLKADLKWLFVCSGLALSYYLLDAVNLMLYTRIYKKSYTFKEASIIALISPFFNGITPFASGGQVAQVYVYDKQGIDYPTSIGIMLMHFITYQTILVIYTAFVLLTNFQFFFKVYNELAYLAILGFMINSVVISALYAGSISKRFQGFIVNVVLKIGNRFKLVKDYDKAVVNYQNKLDDFRNQIKLLFNHKGILFTSLLINIVRLSLMYMVSYFAFKTLHMNTLGYKPYLFIGITSFISLMTSFIPIPGASGGSEGFFVGIFGAIFGEGAASRAMLVWRFATYYLMMFVGFGVFVFIENKMNKKN